MNVYVLLQITPAPTSTPLYYVVRDDLKYRLGLTLVEGDNCLIVADSASPVLQPGDYIWGIAGYDLEDLDDVSAHLRGLELNSSRSVSVSYSRNGSSSTLCQLPIQRRENILACEGDEDPAVALRHLLGRYGVMPLKTVPPLVVGDCYYYYFLPGEYSVQDASALRYTTKFGLRLGMHAQVLEPILSGGRPLSLPPQNSSTELAELIQNFPRPPDMDKALRALGALDCVLTSPDLKISPEIVAQREMYNKELEQARQTYESNVRAWQRCMLELL